MQIESPKPGLRFARSWRFPVAQMAFVLGLATASGVVGAQGPQEVQAVYAINRQAIELLNQGRYDEAIATAKRAVDQAETRLGKDHPGLAASLSNLGYAHVEGGRYAEAEAPLRRAVDIGRNSWGIGPADMGALLNNLGLFYSKVNRLDDAERMYRQALGLGDGIGTPHLFAASWLNNLANLYIREGRYQDAWQLAEKSMVLLPERSNRDPAIAETFSLMGSLKARERQYDDARKFSEWALDIRERSFGDSHPVTASSLHSLGMVLDQQGESRKAEELMMRALAIREKLPADHPDLGRSLIDLGAHFHANGKPAVAQAYFDRAFVNLRARLLQYDGFMSEDDRLGLLDDTGRFFSAYFDFVLAQAKQQPELAGGMYDAVLARKGMVAVSMRALLARIDREGDPQALALVAQLRESRTLLSNLRRRGVTGEAVDRLAREGAELERQLARRSTVFASQERQGAKPFRWQEVRGSLKPDEAAVEYLAFESQRGTGATAVRRFAALVLAPGGRPQLISLGDDTSLAAPMKDYRRRAGLDRDPPRPGERSFYQAFWQPLEAALGQAKRVHLAPDDVLNQVAWATVADAGGLLGERLDLRLLSSTRDLVAGAAAPAAAAGTGAVLVGDVDFGSSAGAPAFGALPGTREELAALARLFGDAGWQVKTVQGKSATEAYLKGLRHPRVLHLASHGFFERQGAQPGSADDPMLRSGLALAGANGGASGDREDGVLTALEASMLDLRGTELVVLSACETGLGRIVQSEGVFGLRRAFELAGAQSVVMSLWKVPDEETRVLMTLFYGKWLAGMDKHLALRDAQLELRQRIIRDWGRDRPQLWGAFVIVGH
ncbi:CHAT domain-containing tetratricopeptide repeat protein [Variovorax saccharolyticus]|uniref:CHAT domain-containing tetratricopeptide repeat protein n=1 Tax=Variovorax saccharolyticus TaxID=3053516 RepID=UPI002578B584|nr:CHAT domain-containing tetratricopeptide repeat protein [Variovorax sp. J31P216]MDM0025443.1 CHAT domain-containing protein [Variovorax sp. J31P216]